MQPAWMLCCLQDCFEVGRRPGHLSCPHVGLQLRPGLGHGSALCPAFPLIHVGQRERGAVSHVGLCPVQGCDVPHRCSAPPRFLQPSQSHLPFEMEIFSCDASF